MNLIQRIKDLIFILVLGGVCTLFLLGIRAHTRPRIERYEARQLKTTILQAAGIAYTPDQVDEIFKRNIKRISRDDFEYFQAPDGRYIFEFEDRGLWGMIKGVETLKPDLQTIDNIKIIAQEETPGLGGRIAEEWFLAQFAGKKLSPGLVLMTRRKAVGENEVDAITGASLSSQAALKMINESGKNFRRRLRKQGK